MIKDFKPPRWPARRTINPAKAFFECHPRERLFHKGFLLCLDGWGFQPRILYQRALHLPGDRPLLFDYCDPLQGQERENHDPLRGRGSQLSEKYGPDHDPFWRLIFREILTEDQIFHEKITPKLQDFNQIS